MNAAGLVRCWTVDADVLAIRLRATEPGLPETHVGATIAGPAAAELVRRVAGAIARLRDGGAGGAKTVLIRSTAVPGATVTGIWATRLTPLALALPGRTWGTALLSFAGPADRTAFASAAPLKGTTGRATTTADLAVRTPRETPILGAYFVGRATYVLTAFLGEDVAAWPLGTATASFLSLVGTELDALAPFAFRSSGTTVVAATLTARATGPAPMAPRFSIGALRDTALLFTTGSASAARLLATLLAKGTAVSLIAESTVPLKVGAFPSLVFALVLAFVLGRGTSHAECGECATERAAQDPAPSGGGHKRAGELVEIEGIHPLSSVPRIKRWSGREQVTPPALTETRGM